MNNTNSVLDEFWRPVGGGPVRLEFHEVLGHVLDQHNLKPAQLAKLIRDKDSMVPKWLRGDRVPQVEDLDLIVSAVNPSDTEERDLQAARRYSALKELLSKPKLALSSSAVEQQLRTLAVREHQPGTLLVPVDMDEELRVIRQMRLEGRPLLALGAMEVLSRQVAKDQAALQSKECAPLLAAFLKERLSLIVNTVAPGLVFNSIREDVERLVELGRRHRDQELIAHAHFRAGDAHHLDLDPDAAIPYCEWAIRNTSDVELKARSLSIMLISIAKRRRIEDRRRYHELARRAEQIAGKAEDGSIIGFLWLLNEWGHSLARLGEIGEAEATLDLAWGVFEELETEGLKYKNLRVALRRATLVAASKGAYGMSGDEVRQMSRELRDEALEGHYPRIVRDATTVEKEVLRSGL